MSNPPDPTLITTPPSVVNVGVELLADALRQQDVPVIQVQWTPPDEPEDDLMSLLDSLI